MMMMMMMISRSKGKRKQLPPEQRVLMILSMTMLF